MKIIFLDIDGVLNCETGYKSGECNYVKWKWDDGTDDHHQSFYSKSKELLNKLIEETGAKIVISSTWRSSGLDYMKKVWELEGMKGDIIGITPNLRSYVDKYTIPRGCEIEFYIENILDFRHINWSKELLNKLIDESDAKIVISSTWRHSGIEFMKKVWEYEKMSGEIIGITPSIRANGISIPRGLEIKYFLENDMNFKHVNWSYTEQKKKIEESGIENYIIIDDDSDMLYGQRNHFVHVLPSPRNKKGFNTEYYNQSLTKLKSTIYELNNIPE